MKRLGNSVALGIQLLLAAISPRNTRPAIRLPQLRSYQGVGIGGRRDGPHHLNADDEGVAANHIAALATGFTHKSAELL